jgi:hypothetical protein
MTVLELLAQTMSVDPEWADLIADAATTAGELTCDTWGRKGGSHYKDGQFTKK